MRFERAKTTHGALSQAMVAMADLKARRRSEVLAVQKWWRQLLMFIRDQINYSYSKYREIK